MPQYYNVDLSEVAAKTKVAVAFESSTESFTDYSERYIGTFYFGPRSIETRSTFVFRERVLVLRMNYEELNYSVEVKMDEQQVED